MAEEYLTDDEQLEHVKRTLAQNGPAVLGGIVVSLAAVFGWRHYENHRDALALQAATQFGQLTSAVRQNDSARTRQLADALIKSYPKSPYADQAKLTLARLSVDAGRDAEAIAPLEDVMDHSEDAELKHIARLRLARVLIDEGKPDDAISTLADPPGAFAARYAEVRGDAFYAKKDYRHAASEYETALGAAGLGNTMDAALLELKIADLGLAPAPAAAAAASVPTASAAPSDKAKP